MALTGRDMLGIAQTGCGKTLAFLLPALIHVNAQPVIRQGEGPNVLIIAPTRELAQQIAEECSRFGEASSVDSLCVYGGVPKREQTITLRQGVDIIIATPGRLLDHLELKNTNLRRVTYLVLDEADRMLDMGFETQIRTIMSQVRPDRQLLLYSATWPVEIRRIAKEYLSDDSFVVRIGFNDENTVNKSVKQTIEFVNSVDKKKALIKIFRNEFQSESAKVLIFCATKRKCNKLVEGLRKDGWPALATHGDKTQQERDWVMHQFREGDNPILIATDLASRGIHVDDITCVINFDFPNNIEDYVHRIGRTGRAGKRGKSVSFFDIK
eukprot:UN25348